MSRCPPQFRSFAHVDWAHLHSTDGATAWITANCPIPAAYARIPKDRRTRDPRRDLLEQLHPFSAQTVFELHKAGSVAARARQASDETRADRVWDRREHDWHGAGRVK